MSIAGAFDCVTNTPMGQQKTVFTIIPSNDGKTFTGTNAGAMGTTQLENGVIDGNKITCKMDITSPVPMTLGCEALIEGDSLTGQMDAGAFGKMAISGTRQA